MFANPDSKHYPRPQRSEAMQKRKEEMPTSYKKCICTLSEADCVEVCGSRWVVYSNVAEWKGECQSLMGLAQAMEDTRLLRANASRGVGAETTHK